MSGNVGVLLVWYWRFCGVGVGGCWWVYVASVYEFLMDVMGLICCIVMRVHIRKGGMWVRVFVPSVFVLRVFVGSGRGGGGYG